MAKYDYTSQSEVQRLANNGDMEAEYELAYRYMTSGDFQNALIWYTKIANNPNHPRYRYGITGSAEIHEANGNTQEAIKLLEKTACFPDAIVAKLALGLLYSKVGRIDEGIELIEYAIDKIIEIEGNDDYLKQIECYKIAVAYEGAQYFTKSTRYYNKAIDRCDTSYESDRQLIAKAREAIESNENRKATLGDRG
ncbi:MAG: hypothetical protein LBC71_05005 [Oscillospiraceae bacterium]|jgi:tetratricopeptide (TPR) repeat protein|nr:hypothetical protein [Oscillospiraceae bacterium]